MLFTNSILICFLLSNQFLGISPARWLSRDAIGDAYRDCLNNAQVLGSAARQQLKDSNYKVEDIYKTPYNITAFKKHLKKVEACTLEELNKSFDNLSQPQVDNEEINTLITGHSNKQMEDYSHLHKDAPIIISTTPTTTVDIKSNSVWDFLDDNHIYFSAGLCAITLISIVINLIACRRLFNEILINRGDIERHSDSIRNLQFSVGRHMQRSLSESFRLIPSDSQY